MAVYKKIAFFSLLLCISLEGAQEMKPMSSPPPPCPPCPYSYSQDTTSAFVYGEWLYWLPVTVNPMNWEYKEFQAITGGGTHTYNNQQIETLIYDFTSGFRIGGGIRIGKDGMANNIRPWQIETVYTDFKTSQSDQNRGFGQTTNGTVQTDGLIFPLLPNDINFPSYNIGYTRASLVFKQLDVDFTWPIWLQSDVILRLKTGPIFGWVENSWRSTWVNTVSDSPNYLEGVNLKWDWKGGGLAGGGDIYLPIGLGFAFTADGNFGLLFGPMKQKEAYPLTLTGQARDLYAKHRILSFQPKISTAVGLDYIKTFRKYGAFHVATGWEFNWWFFLNQFGQINSPSYSGALIGTQQMFFVSPGGLILQGLKIQAGLEY